MQNPSDEQHNEHLRAMAVAGEGNLRMGRSKVAMEHYKKMMTDAPPSSALSFVAKCGYAVRGRDAFDARSTSG